VLLVKGAVAWEGPARDARATLEAHMLGGSTTNGSTPSTNGAVATARVVVPSPIAPPPPPPPPGAMAPGGSGSSHPDVSHPSDLWVVGPTFPNTN